MGQVRGILGWLAVVGIALVFLLRVAGPISTLSQVVDEPYHVGSAVALWEARAHVLGVQHPPLPRWVAAVPLVAMGAELPEYRGTTASRKEDAAFDAGVKVLCGEPGAAPDRARYFRLLSGARWAMTLFPILTIVYAYLLGRRFAGVWAGVSAAALVSCDPTLLGHGFWVCTDGAAAAGFLAVLYHGLRAIQRPSRARIIVAGLAVGLGLSCKFSVVLALPALLLIYLVARVRFDAPRMRLSRWALLIVVSFMALWATYAFRIGPLGNSDTLASAPQWSRLPAWLKSTPVPMPALWIGLGRLAAHSAQGHGTEIFGRVSDRGWWYYFSVLELTKTPVVMLAVMAVSASAAIRGKTSPRRASPDLSRAPSRGITPGWVLLWPAAFFFIISSAGSIQIGIRHVLPVTACAAILGGIWLAARSPRATAAVLVLLLAESWPLNQDYIAYYNAPARPWADRIAVGSNYDWGQDLSKLADGPHHLTAIYPIGERQAPLFRTLGLNPAKLDAPPHPGDRVAISLTRRLLGPGDFAFLKDAKKIGRVGDGFDVFELGGK